MATPKPPRASAAELGARRLGRNVTRRNKPDVRKSSADIFKVLSNRGSEQKAIELIQKYAMEADPSRPGYEGNEIIAPFVRALAQLQSDRRLELLQKAGNPEIFRGLPDQFSANVLPLGEFRQAEMEQLLAQAMGTDEFGEVRVPEEPRFTVIPGEPMGNQPGDLDMPLRNNPTTFGGGAFRDLGNNMDKAPIDRMIPGVPVDPDTGMQSVVDPATGQRSLPPLTPEQDAARKNIIDGIIGIPAAQELAAVRGIDPKTGNPRKDKETGKPVAPRDPVLPPISSRSLEQETALTARLSDPKKLLRGVPHSGQRSGATGSALGPAISRLKKDIRRIQGLPIDPNAEPLGHMMDSIPADARLGAGEGWEQVIGDTSGRPTQHWVIPRGPEEVGLETSQRVPPEPTGGTTNSDDFSSEGPQSLPSEDIQDSVLARRHAAMAEVNRRRQAFAENQPEPAINQRANIGALYKGTLGLQGKYDPSDPRSVTVDRQLEQSTRSPADRLMEAIWRAHLASGMQEGMADVGDLGRNQIRRLSDGDIAPSESGAMPGEVNTGLIGDVWYGYSRPDGKGGLEYPNLAPTAELVVDQLLGRMPFENAAARDEFRRIALPILDYSIRRQAPMGPPNMAAYKASATKLQPAMKTSGYGRAFFKSPFGQDYAENHMFNPDVTMNRVPVSKGFTVEGVPMSRAREPLEEIPTEVLNALLDQPVVEPDDPLGMPVEDAPAAVPPPPAYDPLDAPVEGDMGLSMNRMRRGPLSALIA